MTAYSRYRLLTVNYCRCGVYPGLYTEVSRYSDCVPVYLAIHLYRYTDWIEHSLEYLQNGL